MDTMLTPTLLNQDLGFVQKYVQKTEYSSYKKKKNPPTSKILVFKISATSACHGRFPNNY